MALEQGYFYSQSIQSQRYNYSDRFSECLAEERCPPNQNLRLWLGYLQILVRMMLQVSNGLGSSLESGP